MYYINIKLVILLHYSHIVYYCTYVHTSIKGGLTFKGFKC